MCLQPGQGFACHDRATGKFSVCPGADEQIGISSRSTQGQIIFELPVEEEVVPAAHEIDGDGHFWHTRTEVDGFPIVVVRAVFDDALVEIC